jgi:hypothetical protein
MDGYIVHSLAFTWAGSNGLQLEERHVRDSYRFKSANRPHCLGPHSPPWVGCSQAHEKNEAKTLPKIDSAIVTSLVLVGKSRGGEVTGNHDGDIHATSSCMPTPR